MKRVSLLLAAAVVLGGMAFTRSADAGGSRHHHHHGWHGHHRPHGTFHVGINVWRGGHWHHGWHGSRLGWWSTVPSGYYYYWAPVYPYPDFYRPSAIVVERAPVTGVPPQQYWYYCESPEGYYPYVSQCRGEWRRVPVTPEKAR